MILWRWVLLICLLNACDEPLIQPPVTAPAAINTNHYPTVLPLPLVSFLKTNFPQWRVVEKTDYSKTWWSFYDSSYNPCWARTDINDDQLADYALWLKKNNQLQLVICTGTVDLSFTPFIVNNSNSGFNEKAPDLAIGIAIAPPAQIDVVSPQIQSLQLKSNGFARLELEERTRIYYWHNKRIQTFYMK
jgi:hypothetical protein